MATDLHKSEPYRAAFGEFFRRQYPALFAFGFRRCADRTLTNDLIQNLFLRLWEKRIDLDSIVNWDAYLRTALQRDLVRALQQRARTSGELPAELAQPDYETLLIEWQTDQETRERLRAALAELPPAQRAALNARFFEEASYDDIAARSGRSRQTVYNQVHSAIKKLRAALRSGLLIF